MPVDLTRSYRMAAFAGEMRTQPCETGLPRFFTSWLPWMACPSFKKKIEWGMGALSHCLLYQTSFMDVGVKVPDGVEYPYLPVETGQEYLSTPSTNTVIC